MPQYLSPGVYVEEVDGGSRPIEGVATAIAAFVGLAPTGPVNEPTLVTNWSQFTQQFGDFTTGSYLAHAVYGYFQNGGGRAYVVRVAGDGAAGAAGGPAQAALPAAAKGKVSGYRVEALEAGDAGNEITVEIAETKGDDKGDDKGGGDDDSFNLVVKRGNKVEETFEGVTTKKGANNVATKVNQQSKLIKVVEEAAGGALEKPAPGQVKLEGGATPSSATPARIEAADYVGDSSARTGFGGLEAIDDITMVSCPDLMSAYQQGLLDAEGVKAVQLAMISHCELMGDRVAIIDPPPGLNAQQVREWRVDKAGYDSKYAALYWPWVKVLDPASGENVFVPPSGHMAGIWARTDDARGVHKAPANEVIRGAVDIELNITKGEHDMLNPEGINAIRSFPGRGIRVWGARTLSSDPAWKYVNVRRLFNFLEKSILNSTDWVVFEPNDQDLWAKIRRTIVSFLYMQWRAGALFGATPGDAFFVKCDEETNPPEAIDAGQVLCEIGVAPVKPAEFVIFRISQYSAGGSVGE